MSTKALERAVLPETKSTRGKMEAVQCTWNVAQADQRANVSRPMSVTLSRLAQLITCIEYKPKGSKDCTQKTPEPIQEMEHSLKKHSKCQHCGQRVALSSSLELHKCSNGKSVCQTCKDTTGSPCALCGTEASGSRSEENSKASPVKSSFTCTECPRTFGFQAKLDVHMRWFHRKARSSHSNCSNSILGMISKRTKNNASKMAFPCSSCDKRFSNTSQLQRHKRAEHRRDIEERTKFSMKKRKRRKPSAPYVCKYCEKEFLHHLSRLAHLRHQHPDQFLLEKSAAKPSQVAKKYKSRRRGRPRLQKRPAKIEGSKTEEIDEEDENENAEYPCNSCEQVFCSKAALHQHGKIHEDLPEEVEECRACSVCSGGIPLQVIPEDCRKRLFHCVLCAEAFTALDAFLEHCKKHLIQDHEEELNDF